MFFIQLIVYSTEVMMRNRQQEALSEGQEKESITEMSERRWERRSFLYADSMIYESNKILYNVYSRFFN